MGDTVRRAAGPRTPAVHAAGDPLFTRMVEQADAGSLETALAELQQFRA